jgi:hypothetical protein
MRAMFTDKIKELEATKVKVAALEKKIATQLQRELAALPGKYGFGSVAAFLKALKAAAGGKSPKPAPLKSGKRRRRAVITDATRAEVKKMAEAGKTGAVIAKALGISLPSVQNIKKALGLVKARSKK